MSYRVIQWATGVTGQYAVRSIADKPHLELVGARVYDAAKVGRDAGELAGLDPLGVYATDNEEELLATKADCVLWMGQVPTAEDGGVTELCRILASGKNVITIVHAFLLAPSTLPIEMREAIDKACAVGNSSLHFTGIDPGFANEVLGLTLSGICGRIDRISLLEVLNHEEYANADIVFNLMGFGLRPNDPCHFLEAMKPYFGASLQLVAEGLGAKIEDIQARREVWITPDSLDIAAGRIEAGTVGAVRYSYTAIINGEPRLSVEHVTRTRADQAPEWPQGRGYEITIEGEPRLHVTFELGGSDGRSELVDSVMAAALRAVNSIPAVCDAAPGLQTFLDLPMVTGLHTLPS